ncbi:helix-turn-helix domain-containing protein [Halobium salinum]|uniref:Helix-turn-helix domain-containing protein n=1 Tax=Halobium salinum TaxID=1364940 RepID=A0ABD5P916_9EURY|nr:helix-turn-helix domain-containing protein [Halobium salinum]
MIPIVDITIPANAFELGSLLDEIPDIHVELERIVPIYDSIIPLFWVSNGDEDEIVATLQRSPLTESVQSLTDDGKRQLFEVRWTLDADEFVQTLIETRARMLEGESIGEGWEFRLQFHSHDELGDFRDQCSTKDIPVLVRRVYNPHYPHEGNPMSSEQHEALVAAYERGYFDIPRGTTIGELAKTFDISDNAFSQRLRRGLASLVYETMIDQ